MFLTESIIKSTRFTPYFNNGRSLSNRPIVIIFKRYKENSKRKYINLTKFKKAAFIIAELINA